MGQSPKKLRVRIYELPGETEQGSPSASEEREESVRVAHAVDSTIRLKKKATQHFKRPLLLPG